MIPDFSDDRQPREELKANVQRANNSGITRKLILLKALGTRNPFDIIE